MIMIVAATAATIPAVPAVAPSSIAERFQLRYARLRSVRATFSLDQHTKGAMTVVRGRGYDITVGDRRIVSDGRSVWNIQPTTRTVVINAVADGGGGEASVEQIFFSMLSMYRATVVSGPDAKGRATLRLTPPAGGSPVADVTRADVEIDRTLTVRSIRIHDNTSATATYTLRNVVMDNKADESRSFGYTPPAGWQVVDLR